MRPCDWNLAATSAIWRFERLAEFDFDEFVSCSNQMVEKEVPLQRNRLIPRPASRQDKMAIDAGLRTGGGCLPTVIALDAPSPDKKVRALLPRFGENEFVVPRFVAAKEQPGAVVALDVDRGTAQCLRKTRQCLQGRRPMGERIARDFIDTGAQRCAGFRNAELDRWDASISSRSQRVGTEANDFGSLRPHNDPNIFVADGIAVILQENRTGMLVRAVAAGSRLFEFQVVMNRHAVLTHGNDGVLSFDFTVGAETRGARNSMSYVCQVSGGRHMFTRGFASL